MTPVRNMPDVARQKIAVRSRHDLPPQDDNDNRLQKIYRTFFALENRLIDYFLLPKMEVFVFISDICSGPTPVRRE